VLINNVNNVLKGNSSDRYLHFAANIVRQRGGCKQKSIAKGDFAWIFVRNSEGI